MRIGTHIKIMINSLSFLSGLIFYFIMANIPLLALVTGIVTGIYGNWYGYFITKRVKKELPMVLLSLFVSKEEKKKTLDLLGGLNER